MRGLRIEASGSEESSCKFCPDFAAEKTLQIGTVDVTTVDFLVSEGGDGK